MEALTSWLEGPKNKENFYLDDDAPPAPAGSASISAGGSFTFCINLAAPFSISIPRPTGPQKDFVKRINGSAQRYTTVVDALDACTRHCVDAMEFEDDGEGQGMDDAVDDAVDSSAASAQAQRAAMQMELRKLGEGFEVQALSQAATERILKDMKQLRDVKHDGWRAAPVGRDLSKWAVELFDFEPGSQLAKDMEQVAKRTGKPAIEMLMAFPKEYPFRPPFIRVVRPRFVFRTGRVTVGGSICTQLLTDEGWNPIYDVEGIIVTIRQQITDKTSNAQIDHSNTSDYTEMEARQAFERVAAEHKARGWD
jgi:ubiquitin-protein ligase